MRSMSIPNWKKRRKQTMKRLSGFLILSQAGARINDESLAEGCVRFMMIDPWAMRRGTWMESFGSLSMGAWVSDFDLSPAHHGLTCDAQAIAGDYRRVLARPASEDGPSARRRAANTS